MSVFPKKVTNFNCGDYPKAYKNLFNSCVLAGRLRVNMGNIYFEQKKYPQAVKQYRMALDQVPNTHKDMRSAFLRKLSPLIKPLF